MTLSAYCSRLLAVALAMPNCQQMAFHGARSARIHTSLASSGSSQRSHGSVSSILLMDAADGGGRRIGSGVCPTRSLNSTTVRGHVLK